MFLVESFLIVKTWKQFKYSSTGKWISKMPYAINWNTSHNKKEQTTDVNNMDESKNMFREISQIQNNKKMHDFINMKF